MFVLPVSVLQVSFLGVTFRVESNQVLRVIQALLMKAVFWNRIPHDFQMEFSTATS